MHERVGRKDGAPMRMAARRTLAAMLIAFSCGTGFAREQPEGPILLPSQIDLARLVDVAAERLRLNIEYEASLLKGEVMLRLGAGVTDEELWALTNRVLATHGFTTVRSPGSGALSIVPLASAAGSAEVRMMDPSPPSGAGFESLIVRTEHRAPKELAEALSRILSKPGGAATPLGDAPGDLLLISDLGPRLREAQALIALLDIPQRASVLEEVPAVNIPPSALVTLVAQVTAKRELVAGWKLPGEVLAAAGGKGILIIAPPDHMEEWKALIARLDQREEVTSQSYVPAVFGAGEVAALVEQTVRDLAPGDDRWRMVVDALTGTLIITATPSQHAAITALLERLDAIPTAARRPVRAFEIKHRGVGELLPVLRELLQAGMIAGEEDPEGLVGDPDRAGPIDPVRAAAGSRGTRTREAERGRGGVPSGEEGIILAADAPTNTLIAMGDPRALERLAGLIASLDVRQPQVILEVLLVSLSDAQTLDLGIELERLAIDVGDGTASLASRFGITPRQGGIPVIAGAGLTGIILNPGEFSAVLRALQTVTRGRSLSMPRLLVGNNERATLDSILEQPFASTNASDTVATMMSMPSSPGPCARRTS